MLIKRRSDYPATHLLKKKIGIEREEKNHFFSQGVVKAAET